MIITIKLVYITVGPTQKGPERTGLLEKQLIVITKVKKEFGNTFGEN
jgi:hypothetical protein